VRGISSQVLIAAQPLSARLPAKRAANALRSGVGDDGRYSADVIELDHRLEELRFDARMLASRALVIAAPRLDEDTLLRSLPFEIATRARQAGVPCYAVTYENALNPFDARILDLQVVIEARSERALRAAGARLAKIM